MTLDISDMAFRRQYRTSFGITCDILQTCMDAGTSGIPISRVSQKANLSYNAVINNCQKLVDAGMISTNKSKRKYILTITEKGIKLYHELERFQDAIKDIKIRY